MSVSCLAVTLARSPSCSAGGPPFRDSTHLAVTGRHQPTQLDTTDVALFVAHRVSTAEKCHKCLSVRGLHSFRERQKQRAVLEGHQAFLDTERCFPGHPPAGSRIYLPARSVVVVEADPRGRHSTTAHSYSHGHEVAHGNKQRNRDANRNHEFAISSYQRIDRHLSISFSDMGREAPTQ